ncbi:MAG: hypothetical protein E7813_25770 [Bradyrhizobium sp.]|uniref:hypothetical protein n=1 Tax=Bradyrhizobium sp. TaxID=376 RepID=UPI00120BE3D6|nr:hypothetical protein [Bradyrhizobium sp.]THD58767.1 MAG: hypothetical protein E7813_25770 [Bradyrhizobium sp.]
MSNANALRTTPRPPRLTRDTRPDITLPNGKLIKPRVRIAKENGLCEKTVQRMNPETVFVGGVAYCDPVEVLEMIGGNLNRRNAPPKRRRRS